MAEYKLNYEGTYITKGAYEFKAGAPLDTRSVVNTLKALISASVWANQAEYVYKGLPVYVESTDEYYILNSKTSLKTHLYTDADLDNMSEDTAKEHIKLCWQRMASFDDLDKAVQDLGPVFIFKGVATGLTPDKRGVTVEDVSYTPYGTGATQHKVICLGYEHGFPEEYYAWGTVDASNNMTIEFYTDSSVITSDSSQYDKAGSDTSIYFVDDTVSGKRYYFDGTAENLDASAQVGVDQKLWAFTDEDDLSHLYCVAVGQTDAPTANATDVSFYVINDTSDEVYGRLNIDSFKSYEFSPKANPGTIVVAQEAHVIYASNSNNGWVYQVSDEEYASNGLIWVQLGSPDNEWVII